MKNDTWQYTVNDSNYIQDIVLLPDTAILRLQAENNFLEQEIKALERQLRACYNTDI